MDWGSKPRGRKGEAAGRRRDGYWRRPLARQAKAGRFWRLRRRLNLYRTWELQMFPHLIVSLRREPDNRQEGGRRFYTRRDRQSWRGQPGWEAWWSDRRRLPR